MPSDRIVFSDNQRRWILSECDLNEERTLAEALSIPPVIASLLRNRGLTDPVQARQFLRPSLAALHDPFLMPGIQAAAERIRDAVRRGEHITIYGDYDVDGTSATALLMNLFELVECPAHYYVPHRLEEGYGLNAQAVRKLADTGTSLLITVDCGITAVDEVALARELGMDVIVTDHHEPKQVLPDAFALVDPKLHSSEYPFNGLSGVGVAFKLAWAVAQMFSSGKKVSDEFRNFLLSSTALVALGTISDVVPLVDENRVFAVFGLEAFPHSKLPGLRALLEQTGLADKRLSAHDVSFVLGPRLNAAGRMGEADLSVDLLTTTDTQRAAEIAQELNRKNTARQKTQKQMLVEAEALVLEQCDTNADAALVVAGDKWHSGVVGIVAGRLAESFHRPVIVISIEEGVGQGSARSVPGFDIFHALVECQSDLLAFGGHAQAAGLSIQAERIDGFRRRLVAYAEPLLKPEDRVSTFYIDRIVHLDQISHDLVRQIENIAPYGQSNPEPLFLACDVHIAGQPRRVGNSGQHLTFYASDQTTSFRAIAFSQGDLYERINGGEKSCSIVFSPRVNAWRGSEEVELRVRDIVLAGDPPVRC